MPCEPPPPSRKSAKKRRRPTSLALLARKFVAPQVGLNHVFGVVSVLEEPARLGLCVPRVQVGEERETAAAEETEAVAARPAATPRNQRRDSANDAGAPHQPKNPNSFSSDPLSLYLLEISGPSYLFASLAPPTRPQKTKNAATPLLDDDGYDLGPLRPPRRHHRRRRRCHSRARRRQGRRFVPVHRVQVGMVERCQVLGVQDVTLRDRAGLRRSVSFFEGYARLSSPVSSSSALFQTLRAVARARTHRHTKREIRRACASVDGDDAPHPLVSPCWTARAEEPE